VIRIRINLVDFYLRKNPNLKRALRMAHIKQLPEQFVKKGMLLSLYASAAIAFVFFMFFSKFSIKSLEDNSLVAEISGEPVSPEKGETVVKAVTYHKFQLEEKDGKYKATVSLDI